MAAMARERLCGGSVSADSEELPYRRWKVWRSLRTERDGSGRVEGLRTCDFERKENRQQGSLELVGIDGLNRHFCDSVQDRLYASGSFS